MSVQRVNRSKFLIALLPALAVVHAQTPVPSPFSGGTSAAIAVNQNGEIAADYSLYFDFGEDQELEFDGTYKSINGAATLQRPPQAYVTAINNLGDMVGTLGQGSKAQAYLTKSGITIKLGSLAPGAATQAYGINDQDQIVGCSGTEAFLWQKGKMTDLGPGCAYAINNSGQIVGGTVPYNAPCELPWLYAVTWPAGGTTPVVLTSPHACNVAKAINDSGVIVGAYSDGFELVNAVLWQSGTQEALAPSVAESEATGIDAAGRVVGFVIDPSLNEAQALPFVWQSGSLSYLPTGGVRCISNGISPANGYVVGNCGATVFFAVMWNLGSQ